VSFWDFDWAKRGYKWLDNALSSVVPDVIEKPLVATKKGAYASLDAAKEYALKPAVRSATIAAFDAANIFEYLAADTYESVFKRKEYLERVKQRGPLGYFTDLQDQLIIGQGTSDTGTGYLPGGEATRRSQQNILADRPTVGELPFTIGRAAAYPPVALGLYSQDSILYKMTSGAIDVVKAVKNPVDPFNWIGKIRPAGIGAESVSATANTKIIAKQDFTQSFDQLEDEILNLREELAITPRQLTPEEVTKTGLFNQLTSRVPPTLTREVNDPLLPGTKKTVQSYNAGDIYESWRPDVDDMLQNAPTQTGAVIDIAPSMVRNNYQRWRSSAAGTEWAQTLMDGVRSGSLNAGEVWRTVLNREGPQTAARLVQELANPNATIDDVWRIVDEGVASFEPGFNLRNIGRNRLDAIRMGDGNVIKYKAQQLGSRAVEILPEDTKIGLTDVPQSARNLDNLLGSFGFNLQDRNQWLSRFFVAVSGSKDELFTFLRDFEYQAVGNRLREITFPGTNRQLLPEDAIRELTSWTQKMADEVRLFATDDIGNGVPLPWLDGDGIGPLRLSQLMGDDYYVMPKQIVEEIVRLTGLAGAFVRGGQEIPVIGKGFKGYEALADGVRNYMGGYWKPARVAKPSHLIRVVPEEVLRGAASGIYEHPMEQMLAMLTTTLRRDALGNVVKGKIPNIVKMHTKLDELDNELIEAQQYLNQAAAGATLTTKQQKLVDQIPELQKKVSDLTAKINAAPQAIQEVLIGPRSRGAMASATGEYAPVYLRMVRRGVMQLPDRGIQNQRGGWIKGMVQEVVDMAYNEDYRRIAAQKLFDDDLVTINGQTKSIADHIASGVTHPYTGQTLVNNLDAVKLWLFDGEGRRFFDQYFDNLANLKPGMKGGGYDSYAVASERVETILNNDIRWVTGMDQTLLDVITTGEYQGGRAVFKEVTGRGSVSPDLEAWIANDFVNLPHAPQKVKFFPVRELSQYEFAPQKGVGIARGLQRLYGFYFQEMYGRVSDFAARSPTWKASYWNRMEELVPLMTKFDARATVDAARKARLTATRLERIETAARMARGEGTLEGANILAEQFATRATNDLLFNANRRSVYATQHKILFPFFEAFREVTTTWLKLMAMNPRIVRNTAQFVDAAQNDGAFTTDQNGRKVFELPMTGRIASQLIGTDNTIIRNFTVGTDAVNIALQMRPGFGPVVQYFVNDFAPATPDYDWLRNFASPFGYSSFVQTFAPFPSQLPQLAQIIYEIPGLKDTEAFTGIAESLLDAENVDYKQKAVIRAHQFLLNNYPDKYVGEDGFSQAFDDAEEIANKITFWRAFTSFAGPGATLTEWVTKTKYGNVDAAIVMDDLYKRQEEKQKLGLPSSQAFAEWLGFWGEIVWPYTGTLTRSNIGGQVASREFNAWASENKDLVDQYPLVAGYLGPRSGDRTFEAWQQQSQSGRREIKDVETASQEAQQRLGNYLYYSFRDNFTEDQLKMPQVRSLLADKLQAISTDLPLYSPPGEQRKDSQERVRRQLSQLRAIVDNPDLRGNGVVQTLSQYFDARDKAVNAMIASNGTVNVGNWGTVKAAKELRLYLANQLAPFLIAQNPAFRDVYEQVLSYEFIVDED
jgi:hypothetical protein